MRVGVETVVLTGSSNTSHRIGTAPDKNKNIVALSRITIAPCDKTTTTDRGWSRTQHGGGALIVLRQDVGRAIAVT